RPGLPLKTNQERLQRFLRDPLVVRIENRIAKGAAGDVISAYLDVIVERQQFRHRQAAGKRGETQILEVEQHGDAFVAADLRQRAVITRAELRVVRGQRYVIQPERHADGSPHGADSRLQGCDVVDRRYEDAKRVVVRGRPAEVIRDHIDAEDIRPFAYEAHDRRGRRRAENV